MLIRNFIFWLSTKKKITNAIGRRGVHHGFALRFIAGETLGEALNASAELNANGSMISLNHLGENVITEDEGRQVRDEYIDMLRELAERNVQGNISIKLTQLGLDLDRDICRQFTREIAAAARAVSRDIEIRRRACGN
jgi:proline dehydrogenase